MPQVGSDRGLASNAITGLSDITGQGVVSTSIEFGSSPLGLAARTQALFSIPNANFSILPNSPATRLLDGENPLPFWSVVEDSNGRITATSTLNTTTNTWGVALDPSSGSAITSDSLTMKSRSYLISDDALAVRQKAYVALTKSGTAGGTAAQWSASVSAEYFDANGSSLSGGTPYAIGTATDIQSFTSINGFTTTGGTAISSSAQYVDLTITLSALGTVTGTAKATLTSAIIQTSTGNQSFVITETFSSSTTWTRPTSVEYLLGVMAIGAGGGGGGGGRYSNDDRDSASGATAGGGGGAGAFVYGQNLYVGDVSTVAIGIGAGGAGGTSTAATVITTSGTTAGKIGGTGGNGATGGDTTFGAYITAKGATGGQAGGGGTSYTTSIGGTPGTPQTGSYVYVYGGTVIDTSATQTGGTGFIATTSNQATALFLTPTLLAPFNPTYAIGGTAQSSTASSWTATVGTVTASSIRGVSTSAGTGLVQGGAGGGGGRAQGTTLAIAATTTAGGTARFGGAGGGGAAIVWNATSVGTVSGTLTGGDGGAGASNSGAGGGGGGGVAYQRANFTAANHRGTVVMTSGKGGSASGGLVVIAYVG